MIRKNINKIITMLHLKELLKNKIKPYLFKKIPMSQEFTNSIKILLNMISQNFSKVGKISCTVVSELKNAKNKIGNKMTRGATKTIELKNKIGDVIGKENKKEQEKESTKKLIDKESKNENTEINSSKAVTGAVKHIVSGVTTGLTNSILGNNSSDNKLLKLSKTSSLTNIDKENKEKIDLS